MSAADRRAADFDGDGKAEVFVLSEKEKQIARSVLEDGRLSFPTPLPTSGDPVALDVADLDGDGVPEILYVSPATRMKATTFSPSGPEAREVRHVHSVRGGRWTPRPEQGSKAPRRSRWSTSTATARPTSWSSTPYGPPVLLLGRVGEPPAPGRGPRAAGRRDAGGPLVSSRGARPDRRPDVRPEVALDKSGQWAVLDQFNSGRSSAQVIGAAAIDIDGDEQGDRPARPDVQVDPLPV